MTVPFRLSRRGLFFSGLLVLILCMMVNCWHTHLWGPDEPREAEIAREIFETGSYVVPRFSGLPFVEKPPLYYDVSAWIFSFSPHPGSLRMHSALLGCLMLAALYVFAAKKADSLLRCGVVHCASPCPSSTGRPTGSCWISA